MLNCTDRDGVRAKCLIAAIATGNDAFVVAALNSARVGKTCDTWLGRRSKSPSIPWIGSTRGVEKPRIIDPVTRAAPVTSATLPLRRGSLLSHRQRTHAHRPIVLRAG
jgi:hypothetical protein